MHENYYFYFSFCYKHFLLNACEKLYIKYAKISLWYRFMCGRRFKNKYTCMQCLDKTAIYALLSRTCTCKLHLK